MNLKHMKKARDLAAGDIKNANLIVLNIDMTLQEAADVLGSDSISGAPVLDGMEVAVGVTSYLDIARNCSISSQGRASAWISGAVSAALESEQDAG
ncbi:MAG: CBS domain-containing protein [Acidobacteriota bacterium]